jgi:MFS family permease
MIRRPWSIVGLLCLLAILSYLDRYIVALLANDIMRDLHISDVQIGLLIGMSFGLLYSIISLPIAYFLDRGSRVRLVLAGVVIWSACTMASGLVQGYAPLFALRAGVAVGEAVLTPAAISLIADMFPRERRTLPTSLYMATSALMGAAAFIIGGALFAIATRIAPETGLAPWRVTMTLVGCPGLILAAVWAFVRDPGRREARAAATSIPAAARYLWSRRRLYGLLYGGLGLSALGSYAFIAWGVTIIIRSYAMPVASAGYIYGSAGLVAAVAASIGWPALTEWCRRRGRHGAPIALLALGLCLGHVCLALLSLAPRPGPGLVLMGLATFCFATGGSLPVLAIQFAAPDWMRAKLVSLYMLIGNLIGLVLGPPLCAALAEHLFDGPDALRSSLAVMGAVLAPLTAIVILAARAPYLAVIARDQ